LRSSQSASRIIAVPKLLADSAISDARDPRRTMLAPTVQAELIDVDLQAFVQS
jgi:hypothetical protein